MQYVNRDEIYRLSHDIHIAQDSDVVKNIVYTNRINLFDETKKEPLISQIVRVQETAYLGHGGPRQSQASDNDKPMKNLSLNTLLA